MKKIILASSSPRRKDILEKMNINFEIIHSSFDESLDDFEFSYEKIENLAYQKAKAVSDSINFPAHVLGADTVVVLQGQILGKPNDKQDARKMLQALSNCVHSVVTSHCLIDISTKTRKIISTTSYVEFMLLTDEQIDFYIENFMPLDKAGAYGIQEMPKGYIKSVQGSFENVMGLCPEAVQELLDFNL